MKVTNSSAYPSASRFSFHYCAGRAHSFRRKERKVRHNQESEREENTVYLYVYIIMHDVVVLSQNTKINIYKMQIECECERECASEYDFVQCCACVELNYTTISSKTVIHNKNDNRYRYLNILCVPCLCCCCLVSLCIAIRHLPYTACISYMCNNHLLVPMLSLSFSINISVGFHPLSCENLLSFSSVSLLQLEKINKQTFVSPSFSRSRFLSISTAFEYLDCNRRINIVFVFVLLKRPIHWVCYVGTFCDVSGSLFAIFCAVVMCGRAGAKCFIHRSLAKYSFGEQFFNVLLLKYSFKSGKLNDRVFVELNGKAYRASSTVC